VVHWEAYPHCRARVSYPIPTVRTSVDQLNPADAALALPYLQELEGLLTQLALQGPRGSTVAGPLSHEPLEQATRYLTVAYDHLVTFETVASQLAPVVAGYTLLRPALEASQRTRWLLEVGEPERSARSLSLAWDDTIEHSKDVHRLKEAAGSDLPASPARELERMRVNLVDERDGLLTQARALGLMLGVRETRRGPTKPRSAAELDAIEHRQISWLGVSPPSVTDLMATLLSDEPGMGVPLYRQLSAATHGRLRGTSPSTIDKIELDGDRIAAKQVANDASYFTARFVVTGVTLMAAGFLADAAGYCRHLVMLADRGESDHRRGRGPSPSWPPPLPIRFRSRSTTQVCACCERHHLHLYNLRGQLVHWCKLCPPQGWHLRDFERVTGHQLRR
jgi:hypothetical protein